MLYVTWAAQLIKNDVEERVSIRPRVDNGTDGGCDSKWIQNEVAEPTRLGWPWTQGSAASSHIRVGGTENLRRWAPRSPNRRLEALLRRTDDIGSTADLGELIERFCDEEPYPTDVDEEQKHLREQWRTKLLSENIKDFRRTDLRGVWHNMLGGVADYIWPDSSELSDRIRGLSDLEYDRLIENIRYLCWNDDEELWKRYDALKDANSRRKAPNGFADVTISKLLAICHPKRFLPIGAQDGSPRAASQMLERLMACRESTRQ